MGMLIYDALVLARVAEKTANKNRVLTLGVPSLNFNDEAYRRASGDQSAKFSDHAGFFRHLGFTAVDSLDISDYEGADIVGDLNNPALADKIPHRYDLIYDSGTLEHVFEAPTALRTLSHLTSIGGAMVHSTPANGFMDHGFWQVSPDLFRSFYQAEGFSILTSTVFVLGDFPFAFPAESNIYRTRGRAFIAANLGEAIAVFAARKDRNVERSTIRLQEYYREMHEGGSGSQSSEFFINYGAPVRAKIGRNPLGRMMIKLLQRLRAIIRSGAGPR